MNPILVHFLNCRRNWSFPVRCCLFSAGAVLLLAAGSAGASGAVPGWSANAGAPIAE